MGLDAEKHAGQRVSGEPSCARSQDQAKDFNPGALSQDEFNRIASVRSQRHTDANLTHTSSHVVSGK
jgi:hypothetical protein